GQATVVKSTEQSLNRVDQIRQEFNVGSKRNIAFAEYEINGKKGELIGVSGNADRVGTVGVPDKRIFDTITTGNNPRTLDSEVKILEDLSSSLSKDASGKVYLFSELPFCISCAGVIKQFKQRFPNIDVIIDHGPGGK
ncbi:deaminase domain-containing protein, partial [Lysinibacillus sphaericus]|uniref:deaminase domain-containing protein n=1 Tax=Lysinibacillus sphaericus TaxID=1421 RepID=UPI0025A24A8E